jgi:peptidoglycan hydrolase CwlO-like protein
MGWAMALEQMNEKSLHNRVNDYLNRNPALYTVVESEEETIEAILDELNKAQEDLKAVKERIRRLKWALARVVP